MNENERKLSKYLKKKSREIQKWKQIGPKLPPKKPKRILKKPPKTIHQEKKPISAIDSNINQNQLKT